MMCAKEQHLNKNESMLGLIVNTHLVNLNDLINLMDYANYM